jgi:hypothetical protein
MKKIRTRRREVGRPIRPGVPGKDEGNLQGREVRRTSRKKREMRRSKMSSVVMNDFWVGCLFNVLLCR